MSSIENSSENSSDSKSVPSQENIVPITPKYSISDIKIIVPMTPKSSPPQTPKSAPKVRNRSIATKTMVHKAVKALSENSRKRFSLASIRKYIQQHYIANELELQTRMRYVKKFVRNALENGQLRHVKGTGLTGSFRVPTKKAKKTRLQKQHQRKSVTKRTKQAGEKRQRKSEKPLKKRRTQFSAVM